MAAGTFRVASTGQTGEHFFKKVVNAIVPHREIHVTVENGSSYSLDESNVIVEDKSPSVLCSLERAGFVIDEETSQSTLDFITSQDLRGILLDSAVFFQDIMGQKTNLLIELDNDDERGYPKLFGFVQVPENLDSFYVLDKYMDDYWVHLPLEKRKLISFMPGF